MAACAVGCFRNKYVTCLQYALYETFKASRSVGFGWYTYLGGTRAESLESPRVLLPGLSRLADIVVDFHMHTSM